MKALGTLVLILLSCAALAGPGGGGGSGGGSHGGGGGGGSHGGGGGGGGGGGSHMGGGGGGHVSAAGSHVSVSGAHAVSHGASLARAAAPAESHLSAPSRATASVVQPKKPGFWRRHLHHFFNRSSTPIEAVCTEEDLRLGRCPGRPDKR